LLVGGFVSLIILVGWCCRWAATEGQDFLTNYASPYLDFAAIHLWPDNWQDTSLSFVRNWIAVHDTDAAFLKKPVCTPLSKKVVWKRRSRIHFSSKVGVIRQRALKGIFYMHGLGAYC
jgi:hypothetical protein